MEDGQWCETKAGTPQGAVVSPLLANLYLHYVLDLWVQAWRKKVAHGDVIVVRYADDAVLVRIPVPGRSREVPGGLAGARAEVRAGVASGEDAPAGIWALCRGTAGAAWGREAGNLRLFGFHSHLWEESRDGLFHVVPEDDRQAHGSQAEEDSATAPPAGCTRRSRTPRSGCNRWFADISDITRYPATRSA
jgi:hypothetical protein